MMTCKFPAAKRLALLLAATMAVGLGATQGNAQPKRQFDSQGRPYYGANGPNVVYQQGPRTRVYITRRSWLDAGTEVLPGERKFTDYVYPPTYMSASPAASWDPTGIHRYPLPMPFELPGFNPYLPY
jgi:hypothetical protein